MYNLYFSQPASTTYNTIPAGACMTQQIVKLGIQYGTRNSTEWSDSQTDTDTKPGSYECCTCNNGLARSTSNAATSWLMTPKPSHIILIICILPYPAAEIQRAVKHFGNVESGDPSSPFVDIFFVLLLFLSMSLSRCPRKITSHCPHPILSPCLLPNLYHLHYQQPVVMCWVGLGNFKSPDSGLDPCLDIHFLSCQISICTLWSCDFVWLATLLVGLTSCLCLVESCNEIILLL
jgi:hypothetical protein